MQSSVETGITEELGVSDPQLVANLLPVTVTTYGATGDKRVNGDHMNTLSIDSDICFTLCGAHRIFVGNDGNPDNNYVVATLSASGDKVNVTEGAISSIFSVFEKSVSYVVSIAEDVSGGNYDLEASTTATPAMAVVLGAQNFKARLSCALIDLAQRRWIPTSDGTLVLADWDAERSHTETFRRTPQAEDFIRLVQTVSAVNDAAVKRVVFDFLMQDNNKWDSKTFRALLSEVLSKLYEHMCSNQPLPDLAGITKDTLWQFRDGANQEQIFLHLQFKSLKEEILELAANNNKRTSFQQYLKYVTEHPPSNVSEAFAACKKFGAGGKESSPPSASLSGCSSDAFISTVRSSTTNNNNNDANANTTSSATAETCMSAQDFVGASLAVSQPHAPQPSAEIRVANNLSVDNTTSEEKDNHHHRSSHASPDECVICMDGSKNHIAIPCGHVMFCGACAGKMINESCPICNNKITSVNITYNV